MKSFSGLGISLSLVFGCLLLALVAEIYYLLWWKKKKRISNREIDEVEEDVYSSSNYAKGFFHLICWKKPQSNNTTTTTQDPEGQETSAADLELGTSKDLLIKAFGEESVEVELRNLHNLAGPPRFLFTINEETKEDLESESRSRKGSRTRSLSDLILTVDTPFLSTTMASPPLKSPPLDSYFSHGFNPLFESSVEAELNRLKSSPPPKFKFLRDAEEKLIRKLVEEAEKRASKAPNSTVITEETKGSFLGFIVGKNKEREQLHHNLPQFPSSSSQVLPLA